MRLFVAVNFTEETVARFAALRDELRIKSARGNFSRTENLHLTLVFVGECGEAQTAAAKAAVGAVDFDPFELTADRVGRFRGRDGDIWWAGVRESEALSALQRGLADRLIAAGFSLEARQYSPHVTLGRGVVTGAEPWRTEPFGETVRRIDLMKSERIAGKLTYTPIHSRGG